ncbi:hypothetical protein [Archangium sp. Cb G35]|uniref:hypothetical protein n=1 Tax=Archangium sp. Cb G35 TaxID=1920190 RepID=UPI000936A82A|nr:hypothetical protein [Archangium sp. Cb G35]
MGPLNSWANCSGVSEPKQSMKACSKALSCAREVTRQARSASRRRNIDQGPSSRKAASVRRRSTMPAGARSLSGSRAQRASSTPKKDFRRAGCPLPIAVGFEPDGATMA